MSKEFIKSDDLNLSDEELNKGENCECEEHDKNQKTEKEPYHPKWTKILGNKADQNGTIPLKKEEDEMRKAA
ncbi:hypothetical protein HZB06_01985 [Candidatus Wolfebacteria bacterium]|nr:hypothetical protein [Candidatus Wolfebacteria bacterium]